MLLLALACRPATPDETAQRADSAWTWNESGGVETGATGAPDLLLSIADGQEVVRLRFPDGDISTEPDVVWRWSLRDDFAGRDHKPHGLTVDGDSVLVTCFDYFTDSMVVRLSLATGELLGPPRGSGAVPWAGQPGASTLRAAHNTILNDDGFLISDTHHHRVLAVDSDWDTVWEINQQTIGGDRTLRQGFSNVNDVERVELDGEERLLVSTRAPTFNTVMLFTAVQPLVTGDPPWAPMWRWPTYPDRDVLLEPHNPRVVPGGFTVADSGNDRVRGVSWTGEALWTFPDRSCEASDWDLDWPRDVVQRSDGVLLIADTLGDKLIAVDPTRGACFSEDTVLWSLEDLGRPYQVEPLL